MSSDPPGVSDRSPPRSENASPPTDGRARVAGRVVQPGGGPRFGSAFLRRGDFTEAQRMRLVAREIGFYAR